MPDALLLGRIDSQINYKDFNQKSITKTFRIHMKCSRFPLRSGKLAKCKTTTPDNKKRHYFCKDTTDYFPYTYHDNGGRDKGPQNFPVQNWSEPNHQLDVSVEALSS